ncbi:zinc-dependent alcohol dehydrogenase [Streptomyces cucumeris]|uniref:zinc-dependent alcohol dehydrogenase n=1 Tax=Streptomyces cucumeris TaxID=2962890 RepID=UPI003D715E64
MKALRKLAATHEHFELVEVAEPKPEPGWVVLDVIYAGICGTDLHIMHNAFPSWPPVTVGHEFLGRVASTAGVGVTGWVVGDRVVCEPHSLACGICHLCRRGHAEVCMHKRSPGWGIDGGMAERVHVPAHLLHRVPAQVSDLDAALCEPTAIVMTALERTPIPPGGTVLVFGPGPIGLLAAMAVRACGAGRVVLVGRPSSQSRLDLAQRLDIEVWDSTQVDVVARAQEITSGRGADLVLETSGAQEAVASAIAALRRRGRLCVLGVPDSPTLQVPWATAMNRALDVTFSLSSSWASWDAALALMAHGAVHPGPLATVFPLTRWQEAFTALSERRVVKALLDPRAP